MIHKTDYKKELTHFGLITLSLFAFKDALNKELIPVCIAKINEHSVTIYKSMATYNESLRALQLKLKL